jgi:hypothetical protein
MCIEVLSAAQRRLDFPGKFQHATYHSKKTTSQHLQDLWTSQRLSSTDLGAGYHLVEPLICVVEWCVVLEPSGPMRQPNLVNCDDIVIHDITLWCFEILSSTQRPLTSVRSRVMTITFCGGRDLQMSGAPLILELVMRDMGSAHRASM